MAKKNFFFFYNFNKNGQKEGKIQLKNKEKKKYFKTIKQNKQCPIKSKALAKIFEI